MRARDANRTWRPSKRSVSHAITVMGRQAKVKVGENEKIFSQASAGHTAQFTKCEWRIRREKTASALCRRPYARKLLFVGSATIAPARHCRSARTLGRVSSWWLEKDKPRCTTSLQPSVENKTPSRT